MPLKLIKPREGKTPYWYVRGTHLGVPLDRSTKLTDRTKARKMLQRWREEIERGELTGPAQATFLSASAAYLKAGGRGNFLPPLLDYFGDKPLRAITQTAIDEAALAIYPNVTPATRNRQVYTPVSAVLKYAKVDFKIRRPKGSQGNKRTAWLWPEQVFRLFEAARQIEPEFEAFLIFLCYTGMRLSEALTLPVENVRLSESFAYLPTSKNEDPRAIFLPPIVVETLERHPRGMDRPGERLFRFVKCPALYQRLWRAREMAGPDVSFVTFHTFCHTWATWMRRYGKLDTRGLVATGRWRDESSAARYEHVVVSEESEKAALLPTPTRGEIVEFVPPLKNPQRKRG